MVVVDTHVLSEQMKPNRSPQVHAWFQRHNPADLFTAAVCEAEILYGIAIKPDGRRKRGLETAADRVLKLFSGRILPFDSAAAAVYAAIAVSRGMILARRNATDFAATGATCVDPCNG